jgi:hypothetical protein
MVRANYPNRAGIFENTPTCLEPFIGKLVICGVVGELIPSLIDSFDFARVGTAQLTTKLKIVWWVGKNKINALFRQRCEYFTTIPVVDMVELDDLLRNVALTIAQICSTLYLLDLVRILC